MKKFIAILFIAALCGTLLPGVLPFEKQQVVLFSTTEEEHQAGSKEVKGKEEPKALYTHNLLSLASLWVRASHPNFFILYEEDPFLDNQTPPPDSFC
jgi:hypothetical protein